MAVPIVRRESWMAEGACRDYIEQHGLEVWRKHWFPDRYEGFHTSIAKKVCESCPVIAQCLDYAIEFDCTGIWGNTSGRERRKIRAERAGHKPSERWTDRNLQPCGTYAAYRRHLARGEEPCVQCKAERARLQQDRRPSRAKERMASRAKPR